MDYWKVHTHEVSRLTALIPPPRMNLVRYFGVLAPNAALLEQMTRAAQPMGLENP